LTFDLDGLGIAKETTSSTGGAFELSVPKLSLTIKCTSESGTGEVTEEAKDSDLMTLSGCGVVGAEKTCAVKSPGKSAGCSQPRSPPRSSKKKWRKRRSTTTKPP